MITHETKKDKSQVQNLLTKNDANLGTKPKKITLPEDHQLK